MQNSQEYPQRYIQIEGEEVAVTEEVYRAYKRPLWAEHKRREREKRCRDENGNRCTKDCRLCTKPNRNGSVLSLDQFSEDGFEPASSEDAFRRIEEGELQEALHTALAKLEPKDRKIAELFSIGLSERAIADQVGLSQRGVNKRKNRIFAQLREHLKNFA
jgi:RNA polymerase sigma factor (sigma-70 family)